MSSMSSLEREVKERLENRKELLEKVKDKIEDEKEALQTLTIATEQKECVSVKYQTWLEDLHVLLWKLLFMSCVVGISCQC